MVAGIISSSSSTSSCGSFDSFDEATVAIPASATVKFLCSYGGRILPRYPDGKLRYVGGDTRVLAVHRSIPFFDLQAKMISMCGWGSPLSIRCQLPSEDLDDALVSVTSDEDLANLCEEYDVACKDRLHPLKIRAFLFPTQQWSKLSSPSSSQSLSPPARGNPPSGRRRWFADVSIRCRRGCPATPEIRGIRGSTLCCSTGIRGISDGLYCTRFLNKN